ncbi:MAG: hypothetical protein ACRYHQ_23395 [Janthinobacterium lividum]
MIATPIDTLRLQRGAQHVHDLGPRAVAEMVAHVAREGLDLAGALDLMDRWRAGLSVEMVAVTRGDRFPPRPLREVAH